jgi:hypothetical protein
VGIKGDRYVIRAATASARIMSDGLLTPAIENGSAAFLRIISSGCAIDK